MNGPEIGKRMLPLLDIIFILLAFFIILPHGIKTKELVQIEQLRADQRKWRQANRFYRWQYENRSPQQWDFTRAFHLVLNNNEIFLHERKFELSDIQHYLVQEIKNGTDCIIVEIKGNTDFRHMERLKKVLDGMQVISIFTYDLR